MASSARTLTAENARDVAEWCKGQLVTEHDALDHSVTSPGINLRCGDEIKRASVGDIIILQNNGEFTIFKY